MAAGSPMFQANENVWVLFVLTKLVHIINMV
jgi:hypothetical protein